MYKGLFIFHVINFNFILFSENKIKIRHDKILIGNKILFLQRVLILFWKLHLRGFYFSEVFIVSIYHGVILAVM